MDTVPGQSTYLWVVASQPVTPAVRSALPTRDAPSTLDPAAGIGSIALQPASSVGLDDFELDTVSGSGY